MTRHAFRPRPRPRPGLDRGVHDRRPHGRGRAAGSSGRPARRSVPVGEHPGAVHGPRPRRGLRVHRPGASTSAPRPSTWPGRCSRRRPERGRRRGHLRARPLRAGVHVPAADRLRDRRSSPARSPRAGGSPVFIQGDHYQFNAKKYAADPEAMTEEIRRACRTRDRGRLRQHRHRLAPRSSTCRSRPSTSSSARTTRARPSSRRSSASSRPTA